MKLPEGGHQINRAAPAISQGNTVKASSPIRVPISGHALGPADRAFMESGYGFDFSRVRVHADAASDLWAARYGARALTAGTDIVFAEGQFQPNTTAGRRLLAHELAHVVQQDLSSPSRQKSTGIALTPDASRLVRLSPADEKVSDKVVAHGASEAAIKEAQKQLAEIFENLQTENIAAFKGMTIELHIIPASKKLTDLPEFASLKGVKTWEKGRTYDDLRGVGATKVGTTIRYAIAEEQLISVKDKPSGYAQGFVGGHESGHVVEQFGLTKDQKSQLTAAYKARLKAKGPWLSPAAYTSGNEGEYFAQGVSAFFEHPYSASQEEKKSYTKGWLEKNDPALFALLSSVFKSAAKAPGPGSGKLPKSFKPRTDFNDKILKSVDDL